ncbi:hypothetical protein UA08_07844 [Talaromyces atroroseus]|uniref:Autophagy-related protein 14 n=1 Tax=Talaromyces atroroseus TaxID=1441469 RepID=A0A225ATB3_TALAT|nr:hypothetical protein UA08_07844 [Talaromyces atroroseus]OKL56707.1 hypothetical protein UA08_07844 [Talaromyces atroroseus]
MSCSICARTASNRSPFYCPTCARSHLYTLRYETARVLLEKESIGREVEAAVSGDADDAQNIHNVAHKAGSREGNLKWGVQAAQTEQARSLDRIRTMRHCAETLKTEIEQRKTQIHRMRLQLRQRRSDAESANFQLSERRNAALANIQNGIKRTEHLWHSLHNKTAESRIFLCREAAHLYGLRREFERKEGGQRGGEQYYIGGVPIVDLRNLNGASPSQISTALCNISHLLIVVSHYLSLRLPAEIILPHRNHATPTIFAPATSYSTGQDALGDTWHPYTASNPRDARKHRSRPLSVEKTLPRLVKEEPATYALFVEGVSLLAWNISWLCRTQGLNVGSDSWEDICNIGKNIWQLLVSPTAPNTNAMRAVSGRDLRTKLPTTNDNNSNTKSQPKTIIQRTKSFPMLGHYSHGTSHSFLGAAEGVEFMKTWKLPTPAKIADKLKSALLGEMANAEWELLEEKEWDDEADSSEKNKYARDNITTTTTTTTTTTEGRTTSVGDNNTTRPIQPATSPGNRVSGTSGWTKLKSKQER